MAKRAPKGVPAKARAIQAQPGRVSLESILNRRVEPNGLVVESYAPRLWRYVGSEKQLRDAVFLAHLFKARKFPKPAADSNGWARLDWEDGSHRYFLRKTYISAQAHMLQNHRADYWCLDIVNDEYTFNDYLCQLEG